MINQDINLEILIEEIEGCSCDEKDLSEKGFHHDKNCIPALQSYLTSEGHKAEIQNIIYRYPRIWVRKAMLEALARAGEYQYEMARVISVLKTSSDNFSDTVTSCCISLGAKQKRWIQMYNFLEQFKDMPL